MKTKYTAQMLFKDFRHAYPELWRYGTQCELCGYMTILVTIPTVGKLTYEYFGDKITWLERWEDPNDIRKQKSMKRFDIYSQFLSSIQDVMDERELSQQDVANITGYSRVSINRYLSGKTYPTYDTMVDIMKTLGIDF